MKTLALALFTGGMLLAQTNPGGYWSIQTRTGADNNNRDNGFVQPQEIPLAGNGIDQSLQFADVLTAGEGDSLLIGRLGADVLLGGAGSDVIVGGRSTSTWPAAITHSEPPATMHSCGRPAMAPTSSMGVKARTP